MTREKGDYFCFGCYTVRATSGSAALLSEIQQLPASCYSGLCVPPECGGTASQRLYLRDACCLHFQLEEHQRGLMASCSRFTSAKLWVKYQLLSILLMQYLISCSCPHTSVQLVSALPLDTAMQYHVQTSKLSEVCLCDSCGNKCREKSRKVDRQKEAKLQNLSGSDCDKNRSSCLDINTYMLNSRHKNVAAISLDVNTCYCFSTFFGLIFRHLQPVWRGGSSLRRSLAQVLRLTCSPVQSVLTAQLGHTHQPSGLFCL